MTASFGHTARTLRFWRRLARQGVAQRVPTPFFLFSPEPIRAALAELAVLERGLKLPVRHWLSCKTQPVPALLRWWRQQGRPVEVVSEFEFLAAQKARFPSADILVNGPAKQRWLGRHPVRGLRVNFDSARELEDLLPAARGLDWKIGLRLLTAGEHDPDAPAQPTQFGLDREEAIAALRRLRQAGVPVETAHFHLRTNVRSPASYEQAMREIAGLCRAVGFAPQHLDCGGGFPPPHVRTRSGAAVNRDFSLREFARLLQRTVPLFPGLREVWFENGRFLSARSGVLVVRILEVKHRRGLRQLICDGGRTLNALVSRWEDHALVPLVSRRGRPVPTAVYGPTCMAFDQLNVRPLPDTLGVGDHLIWLEAGAYHLPWETQFSHGSGAVLWHEDARLALIRCPTSFKDWWRRWRS